jgi:hypothetical protein
MKTRTITERVGEFLGPVDWAYDFTQHDWGQGKGGVNPELSAEGAKVIRAMAAEPDGWSFSPCGFSWCRVVHIGMYDGWPFWRPTPAIGYIGPLGSVEWAFFYRLRCGNVAKKKPCDT